MNGSENSASQEDIEAKYVFICAGLISVVVSYEEIQRIVEPDENNKPPKPPSRPGGKLIGRVAVEGNF